MTKFKKGQRVIAVGTIVSPRGEFSTDHAVVSFSRDDDHDGFAGSAQCAEIALKDLRPTPQAASAGGVRKGRGERAGSFEG